MQIKKADFENGNIFFQNVRQLIPDYTASHPE
jgi:hypothetical protein